MRFIYRNAKGDISTQQLTDGWKESGHYLDGYSLTDKGPRTFLKYRVVEYLEGSNTLLTDPYPPPPVKPAKDARNEILFTGFLAADRSRLEHFAEAAGMKVVKSVTMNLYYLCTGSNAGPKKVDAARERGLYILSEAGLRNLIETGELPDN